MDKSNFNFSVHPSRQPERYVGLCAELSPLSYLANTAFEAYQGIVRMVCNFEEQIEHNKNETAYTQWLATHNGIDCQEGVKHITSTQNLASFEYRLAHYASLLGRCLHDNSRRKTMTQQLSVGVEFFIEGNSPCLILIKQSLCWSQVPLGISQDRSLNVFWMKA